MLISGPCDMKQLGGFLFSLDGMLVHHRVNTSIKVAGTHLYTKLERGTLRVKCLAQEHNTVTPVSALTWTTQARDERTNHEVTTPLPHRHNKNTLARQTCSSRSRVWTVLSLKIAISFFSYILMDMLFCKVKPWYWKVWWYSSCSTQGCWFVFADETY